MFAHNFIMQHCCSSHSCVCFFFLGSLILIFFILVKSRAIKLPPAAPLLISARNGCIVILETDGAIKAYEKLVQISVVLCVLQETSGAIAPSSNMISANKLMDASPFRLEPYKFTTVIAVPPSISGGEPPASHTFA
jgi:hypothetical protein